MSDKKNAIGILFEVLGKGSIDGESGALIKKQLEAIAKNLTLKVKVEADEKQLNNIKQITKQSNQNKNVTEKLKTYEELKKQLEKIKKLEDTRGRKKGIDKVISEEKLHDLKDRYKADFDKSKIGGVITEKNINDLKEYAKKLEDATDAEGNSYAMQIKRSKIADKGMSLYSEFGKVIARSSEAKKKVEEFNAKAKEALTIRKGDDGQDIFPSQETIDGLNNEFIQLKSNLREIDKNTNTLGNKIKEAFNTNVVQKISAALVAFVANALRQVYQNVIALDEAVTNLQIATGYTREKTEALITSYAKLGKQIGATTVEVAEAADTWLRQGYDIAETNELIIHTTMLSKLGQLDSAAAARALTSALKGYKKEAGEALSIVDKLTAVDMEAAVSAGDIATAMAETAASAEISGVSMDKLVGYIAAVGEVTQDGAESVGTFYKTLFARMGKVSAGNFVDEETGESLNDVETTLNNVGITLRKENGEFENFGVVLDTVASSWDNYNNVQQHAIATAFAGTRQQEKFIVLMENYAKASEYAVTSQESLGTAQTKYTEAYLDSIEGKLGSLTAGWEQFSAQILNSDLIKGGIEFLSGIVDILNKIVDGTDGLAVTIPATVAGILLVAAAVKKLKKAAQNKDGFVGLLFGEFSQLKNVFTLVSNGIAGVILNIRAQTAAKKTDVAVTELQAAAEGKLAAARAAAKAVDPTVWITLAVTLIAGLVKVIDDAIKKSDQLRETAIENAKKIQEQADAYKDLKEAAEEASAEIKNVVENAKKMDDLSSGDLSEHLGDVAEEFRKAFGDESLSDLEAINKAISKYGDGTMTQISYEELLTKTYEERIALLENLYEVSKKVTAENAKNAYNEQVIASNAKATSAAMKKNIKAESRRELDMFLENIMGIDVDNLAHEETGGSFGTLFDVDLGGLGIIYDKSLKMGVDGSTAKEVMDNAKAIVDKYKAMYKFDESMLANNAIYQHYLDIYNQSSEAYKQQRAALGEYLGSLINTIDASELKIGDVLVESLDLSNKNLQEKRKEYKNVLAAIKQNILNSNTEIAALYSEGTLGDDQIEEYAEKYIADNYENLADAMKTLHVSLRDFKDLIDEYESEYELLVKAVNDMKENGILSSDVIKELNSEFPELLSYLKEAKLLTTGADGYKLSDNSVSSYLSSISTSIMDNINTAKEYYSTMLDEYENLPADASYDEKLAKYNEVMSARTSLQNAIETAKNWQTVEATLIDEELQTQYKDFLKSQQKALEKEIEQYKTICDVRRDLLKSYQDEINKKKELEKKQTNVANLKTQLALASLDTSAAGRANARELQSQLTEAEEELEEYSLELAIEDINKEIDSSISEYEKFINDRTASIERTIESVGAMTASAIVGELEKHGESPNMPGGSSSSSDEYKNAIKAGENNLTNREDKGIAKPIKADEPKDEYKKYGYFQAGAKIATATSSNGDGTIKKEGNNFRVDHGNKSYHMKVGAKVSGTLANTLNTGYPDILVPWRSIVGYAGDIYLKDAEGEWRYIQARSLYPNERDDYRTVFYQALNSSDYKVGIPIFHKGGLVGDLSLSRSNEVFAKLLQGEFVSTPKQMDTFIKKTLPSIATANGSTIQYNAPIFEIQCGDIDKSTLPDLETIINSAVAKMEKNMKSALSRTGYRR